MWGWTREIDYLDSPHSTRERIGTTTKNPCNKKKKKKNTAAAAEPREEKEEQQQAATESGEKQQQQRRSNLSPQKHRAAKFYAKEDQTQNQDT
jgi:hypothetical protein